MKCYHCGQEIADGARHCMFCGSNQANAPVAAPVQAPEADYADDGLSFGAPAEPVAQPQYFQEEEPAAPVVQPVFVPYEEPAPAAMPAVETAAPAVQPEAAYFANPTTVATAEAVAVPAGTKIIYVQGAKPALELATNRSLTKMFFLGLVTFGIYNVVIFCKMISDLNILASRYDGRRTMPYFAMCALAPLTGFILPIVWTHNLCDRMKVELKRRNIDYKFGPAKFWLWNVLGSLILVGPFVFIHKLMKTMNLLCENYNQLG